jgi:hypothetical protein
MPSGGFLDGLRALCTRHGAVLIFDEVMTAFACTAGRAGHDRRRARPHDARQGDRRRHAGRRVREDAATSCNA